MNLIPHSYNQIAGLSIRRIEALSDGVFAIAMTLLILDIHVPVKEAFASETELFTAFLGLTPKFLNYLMSFMTLGIFWTGHSAQFSFIDRSDRHLNWISLFFLLFVSVLPFTTAFLNSHPEFRVSIALYWLNIFSLGVLLYVHWAYAERHEYISSKNHSLVSISLAIRKRIVVAQTLYAVGALLCFISNYLSIGFIVLVQMNYALALFSGKHLKRVSS